MDKTEKIAEEHLKSRGYATVVYEPDGNVPPDFLVDGRIAVEVRRLNQNEETAGGYRGLEELSIPLLKQVQRFLKTLGPADAGESWYVMYTFERPMPPWPTIAGALKSALSDFKQHSHRDPGEIEVLPGLDVQLIRAGRAYPDFFRLGAFADRDTGGFILQELEKNIRLCAEEKAKKVAKFRSKYPEWWLLLVDYIAHGIEPEDHDQLRKMLGRAPTWDKILVVNPLVPADAFDI